MQLGKLNPVSGSSNFALITAELGSKRHALCQKLRDKWVFYESMKKRKLRFVDWLIERHVKMRILVRHCFSMEYERLKKI